MISGIDEMAGRTNSRPPPRAVAKRAAAIAEHFARRRFELGENQIEFARRIGVTQGRLSEIEQGRSNPKLLTIEEWADRLCMDVADLLRFPAKP